MLAIGHPNRLNLHYILSRPTNPDVWMSGSTKDSNQQKRATRSIGHFNTELALQKIPKGGKDSGCFALLCGPDGFLNEACAPALEALGYPKEMCVYF